MEQDEIARELNEFFDLLDKAFPDGEIIWDNWNHAEWDKTASKLCRATGYSSGAPFLTAYGYGIFVDGKHIPAIGSRPNKLKAPEAKAPAAEPSAEFFTGTIKRILPNNNSGFVRKDGGKDYYFNVRDFTHRVNLKYGMRVRFRLAQRHDHKRNQNSLNAVELTVI